MMRCTYIDIYVDTYTPYYFDHREYGMYVDVFCCKIRRFTPKIDDLT